MNGFTSMNADIRRRTFLGRGAAGLGLGSGSPIVPRSDSPEAAAGSTSR